MKRAAEHAEALGALHPSVLYTDLDGTLLGPGGALLAGSGGSVTEVAAGALAVLHAAGVAVVPVSGRTEDQVREVGRVIGASGFIAEMGGIVDTGSEVIRRYGAHRGPGTPYRAMARTGAAGFLLDTYAGRLEPHAPWAFRGRECTMLFRGQVDDREATDALAGAGYGWLALQDNGRISHPGPTAEVHAYHLAPTGVTKHEAVAEDLRRRGLDPKEAAAIGDGPSDASIAPHVAAMLIVANGVDVVEASAAPLEGLYRTDGERGQGFAEAVTLLGVGR